MRVGFDISALDTEFKAHALRGIGRYVYELKRYFDKAELDQLSVGYFDHTHFKAPKSLDKLIELLPAGRATIRQQLLYPLQLQKREIRSHDVLHFPAHMDAPSWTARRYITTVLDLIPLVCEDLYKAQNGGFRFKLARWLEIRAIKNANHLIAISECTAKDVNRVLGVPLERITVTPLGVNPEFFTTPDPDFIESVKMKFSIPEDRKTVLYVGGIDPRKNYPVLLKAMAGVRDHAIEKGELPPVLLMIGNISGDKEYPNFCKLVKELELEEIVKELGFVEDDELIALYSIGNVFFFPSLYEGFGLTPLEAMACGCPVVSSSTSAMPEILNQAARYFNPTDVTEGTRALIEVLGNQHLADDLRIKGKARARMFTWEQTGDKTLNAYEACLNRKVH